MLKVVVSHRYTYAKWGEWKELILDKGRDINSRFGYTSPWQHHLSACLATY